MTDVVETPKHAAWPWWWSTDEERYHGPCTTRGEAIMEAWSNGNTGMVHICQATRGGFATDLFDDVAEMFDDANEDRGDPDGEPPSEWIKAEEWKKVAQRLNHIFKVFIREQGITSWVFYGMEGQETIDLSVPVLAKLPADAREILADLVTGWSSEMPFSQNYFDLRLKELAEALNVKVEAPVT